MKKITTYKEPRWLKIRHSALVRDKYMDAYLSRYGVLKQAEMVHHIFPVDAFPEYQYELWNLISVTKYTHNQLHDKETDLLSKKGIDLLVSTARKNKIPIPYGYINQKKKKTHALFMNGRGIYD